MAYIIIIVLFIAISFVLIKNHFLDQLKSIQNDFEFKIQKLSIRISELEGGISESVEEPQKEAVQFVVSEVEEETIGVTEVIEPSLFEAKLLKFKNTIMDYFKTGNTVVKVGVVVLFFGVSFLVKFAADKGLVPIEIRFFGVTLLGLGLIKLGWGLKEKKRDYALVLQGGGLGVLFISTFAALKIYHLVSPPLAFFILVALAGASFWLSITQNAISLAIFGISGGFLAPILASTGQGQHVILFSYYVILNLGIVAIAWFKSWRLLNLLGFLFTYVISTVWGILKYKSMHFASTEPFLIIFFLIYVSIPILFAKKDKTNLKGYVDATLVFGNAIFAFGLQAQIVKIYEYGAGISAFVVSIFYTSVCLVLYKKRDSSLHLLIEAFMALGIIFATLAIPLAIDGHLTAAIWAIEAAGIYWISIRQDRFLGRVFSSVLIFASGFAFLLNHSILKGSVPFFNSIYLSCVMIAVGSIYTSYVGFKNIHKLREKEKTLIPLLFVFGIIWWIGGCYHEISRNLVPWFSEKEIYLKKYIPNLSLVLMSLSLLVSSLLGRKYKYRYFTKFSYTLGLFIFIAVMDSHRRLEHPFDALGWLIWPLSFVIYFFILKHNEVMTEIRTRVIRGSHAMFYWFMALVLSKELGWQFSNMLGDNIGWQLAGNGIGVLMIFSLLLFGEKKINWPFKKYRNDYLLYTITPLCFVFWCWVFLINWFSSGDVSPLLYVPVLNPLELMQTVFMILLPIYLFKIQEITTLKRSHLGVILGVTYFFWLNGILMRAIHHIADVPYRFRSLFSSPLVQTSLSIYWSLIAITLMVYSSRKKLRWLWISGASLMGVVVVKLFVIDLSKSDSIERIISFITVGLILLLVGYFSPIPPTKTKKNEATNG